MNVPFEAKYIKIEWEDSKTASKIIEAEDNIEIEPLSQNSFKLEAVTYKKIEENVSGQLAFHINDKQFKKSPYFVNAKNEKIELLCIEDKNSEKIWWIEKGTWSRKSKYRSSVLCRTVGETRLVIGEHTCFIHIGSLSFTYDELELYLKDFRSDLWGLIQRDDSYVLGEAKTKKLKVARIELIEKIQTFIAFTKKILKNPKKELIREEILQKTSQVKPTNKTFIELATKGMSAKYLTGQGYRDSFDVAENRYIFALVQKIITLIGHEIDIADKRTKELKKELEDIEIQIKSLSDKIESNMLSVDKKEINEHIKKILNSQQKKSDEYETIFLRFEKKRRDTPLVFEGKGKRYSSDKWFIKDNITFQFEFKWNAINKFLKENCEYKITAKYKKTPFNKTQKNYKRIFEDISKIELLTNYERSLNENEKREFDYELKALERKESLLAHQVKKTKELYSLLTPQLTQLKKIKHFFINHKIRSRYHFTGSMTFIQNPNYQGSHKIYKKIINQSGINDDLFESLEEIDKIGILAIPTVYERWCLVQIIKVITDKFHFVPLDKNWKEILIESVSRKNTKNTILVFKNSDIDRKVRLTYEMELKNGRVPDFVLDTEDGKKQHRRFIMDAKFYENLDISKVVNELYNVKNYAEGGNNSVFVLHPSKTQKSYYGEKRLFGWDSDFPNHRYGAIFLSPIQIRGNYLNDLQKLIGMFLQYGMEDNQNIGANDRIDPMPREKIFCVICGSFHTKIEQTKTMGGHYKYWITCKDCSHFSIYNFCGKCKNRLIKNGSYWTYHAMDILEPINVGCPYCGDTL